MNGGNTGIDRTFLTEVYYRAAMDDYFAVTGDFQYTKEDHVTSGADVKGVIFAIRLVVEF